MQQRSELSLKVSDNATLGMFVHTMKLRTLPNAQHTSAYWDLKRKKYYNWYISNL